MNHRPKIAVIHPNSLCCLAMRTILTDIAPFVGMFREVDIAAYNSMEEFMDDTPDMAIHYFIAAEILVDNMPYFAPQQRRCIVLTEGEQQTYEGFHTIDIRRPERELLKAFLTMHNTAHTAHGVQPRVNNEDSELLSQREKDVLALIVKGYINKEIADELNISLATVVFHRNNICEKLNTRSIGRLTIYAVLNNIVTLGEI